MYDKTTPVRKYGRHEADTGQPGPSRVLTERINSLTDHFRCTQGFHGQRGSCGWSHSAAVLEY